MRVPAGFLGGKIVFERLFIETPHATEEIEFVGCDADAHAVFAEGHGALGSEAGASAKDIGRYALACAVRAGRDRRQPIGALNSILRPPLLYAQYRHAQVA